MTTGHNHNGEVPQSPTRIGGKVLRIDRDGKTAFTVEQFAAKHYNQLQHAAQQIVGAIEGTRGLKPKR